MPGQIKKSQGGTYWKYVSGDPEKKENYVQVNPTIADSARSFVNGQTFGWGDEIGAAIAAVPASIQTGEDYADVYGSMMATLEGRKKMNREVNPVSSTALEVAGGVTTGLSGGAAVGKELVASVPKWALASTGGGLSGGVYGAGDTEGDRLVGAGTGAVIGAAISPGCAKV